MKIDFNVDNIPEPRPYRKMSPAVKAFSEFIDSSAKNMRLSFDDPKEVYRVYEAVRRHANRYCDTSRFRIYRRELAVYVVKVEEER